MIRRWLAQVILGGRCQQHVRLHHGAGLGSSELGVAFHLPGPIQSHHLAYQAQAGPLGDQVDAEGVTQRVDGGAAHAGVVQVLLNRALDCSWLHAPTESGDEEMGVRDRRSHSQIDEEGLAGPGIEPDEPLAAAFPTNVQPSDRCGGRSDPFGELHVEAIQHRCLGQGNAGLKEQLDQGSVTLDVIAIAECQRVLQALVAASGEDPQLWRFGGKWGEPLTWAGWHVVALKQEGAEGANDRHPAPACLARIPTAVQLSQVEVQVTLVDLARGGEAALKLEETDQISHVVAVFGPRPLGQVTTGEEDRPLLGEGGRQ